MRDVLQAVTRIVTGGFWLFFASQKWGGVAWVRPLLQAGNQANPVPGLHQLLVSVVSPLWQPFSIAQTVGETAVGVLLVLGIATVPAAWVGVLLSGGLCLTVAFAGPDIGARWLYYLAVLVNLQIALNGPGQPALGRVPAISRWLRS
jgi:uncharacterized membrane protein YphA (DoxX/SURF4 family)